MDCLVALPLGKWVTLSEDGKPVEAHWGGFRNEWDGRRVAGEEHLNAIAQFCAVHVSHSLGVLQTDDVVNLVDQLCADEAVNWIANVEELAEQPRALRSSVGSNRTMMTQLERSLRRSAGPEADI